MISPYVYPGFKEQDCQNVIDKMTLKKEMDLFKKQILIMIGDEFAVTPENMLSKCRQQPLVDARNLYMVCMKLKYQMSLNHISYDIGKRHHSTVIHSYFQFMNRYKNEEKYRYIADKIFNKIGVTYNGERLTSKSKYK
jgi:chromosomal replication initiation ATPase DnaA